MKDFQGLVSGIDVIATPGQIVRCLAFISKTPQSEIQVTTDVHALQTVLELASSRKIRVEVSYEESGQENKLTRVRLLDRELAGSGAKVLGGLAEVPPNLGSEVLDGGFLIWAKDVEGKAIALAFVPR